MGAPKGHKWITGNVGQTPMPGSRRRDQRATALARKLDPMGHRTKAEPERVEPTIAGRNDPCPCGSGAKVKRCPHPAGFALRLDDAP